MDKYVVVDIETTGIDPYKSKITEIGAIKVENNKIIGVYSKLINPEVTISKEIQELTGISNEIVKNELKIQDVIGEFVDFCENYILVGHNIIFDYSFLKVNATKNKINFEKKGVDTYFLAKKLLEKKIKSKSLTSLCEFYKINRENKHRAYDDALACYDLLKIFIEEFYNKNKEIFEAKQLQFKQKKKEPITIKQKKYLIDLLSYHKINFNKQIDGLTKSEASKMIDSLIFQYGKPTY